MPECTIEAVVKEGEFELNSPESCSACAAQHMCLGDKKKRIKHKAAKSYQEGDRVFLSINSRKALGSSALVFAGALISGGFTAVLAAFYLPEAVVALVFIITVFLWLLACAHIAPKTEIQVKRQS